MIRRTKTRLIWNLIFGPIAAIGVGWPLIALTASGMGLSEDSNIQIGMTVFGIPGLIALIALIINTAKGADLFPLGANRCWADKT